MIDAGITLTGADVRTPLSALFSLATAGAEIGLLWSATSLKNRYPDEKLLAQLVGELGSNSAVHICGRPAREVFLSGRVPWIKPAGRVQINGHVTSDELKRALELHPQIITQHATGDYLVPFERTPLPGHSILVDNSGGRGRSPEAWALPPFQGCVGFAGGLGPDNLEQELPKISALRPTFRWWCDMETKLRAGDWFDVAKAERCVEIFRRFAEI